MILQKAAYKTHVAVARSQQQVGGSSDLVLDIFLRPTAFPMNVCNLASTSEQPVARVEESFAPGVGQVPQSTLFGARFLAPRNARMACPLCIGAHIAFKVGGPKHDLPP